MYYSTIIESWINIHINKINKIFYKTCRDLPLEDSLKNYDDCFINEGDIELFELWKKKKKKEKKKKKQKTKYRSFQNFGNLKNQDCSPYT